MKSRELVAVGVKMPSTIAKRDHSFSDLFQMTVSNFDDGMLGNRVVILPGGIHSLPNGAEPSHLINRLVNWRLCDCYGWPAGCKLKILTNKGEDEKTLLNSRAPLTQVPCHQKEQMGAKTQHSTLRRIVVYCSSDAILSFIHCTIMQRTLSDAEIFSCKNFASVLHSSTILSSSYVMNEGDLKQDLDRAKMLMVHPGECREKHTPQPPHSPVGRV